MLHIRRLIHCHLFYRRVYQFRFRSKNKYTHVPLFFYSQLLRISLSWLLAYVILSYIPNLYLHLKILNWYIGKYTIWILNSLFLILYFVSFRHSVLSLQLILEYWFNKRISLKLYNGSKKKIHITSAKFKWKQCKCIPDYR